MTARYAVYYAPRQDSALWRKASAWLGRDAYDGTLIARPAFPALQDLDLDALTADPRGYGFHATLKAPFELAQGETEADLLGFAAAFAEVRTAFTAEIAPALLGVFHAFRIPAPSAEMAALHEACVRDFDRFRAPLSEHDIARRRRAKLSEDQDRKMLTWGYPYIFDEFRFHMTLTGAIRDEAVSARIGAALADHFAPETGPHLFDGIAIFKQADRSSPFDILARLDFG